MVRRRQFLAFSAAALAHAPRSRAEDRSLPRPAPRATSGDRIEPDWSERLTLTVGQDKGQLQGRDEKVLQAAVDYVARLGGGTVRVLPGVFRFRNALRLASGVKILGSGPETVFRKEPSRSTTLAADSDWFDQEVTLADPKGFEVGDGICLRSKNPHHGGVEVLKRTLVARSGNRFKLDRALRENFWTGQGPTVSSLFPLIAGELVQNAILEDLALDGDKDNNELLDGNYAGCIFLEDCHSIAMRRIVARNYNGDGISWQVCHDVVVRDCHSHDHSGLGLHPGSGSQRPKIVGNRLERNQIGLFFCWGVKGGRAEGNRIEANQVGVSIGHRDTDNLLSDNQIVGNQETGILFRPERGPAFAPHRNRCLRNRLEDNGPQDGAAIDILGTASHLSFEQNTLRETRGPASRAGIRIGKEVGEVRLLDNKIEGFAERVCDLRDKTAAPPRS